MEAEFQIKFKLDLPYIKDKNEMTRMVQRFATDMATHLEQQITRVELLNHTLTISG